ncbi:MAG: ABC transporter ATP-binding protein [Phenylobacterium sp.]|uniref:ABC transporter ATP-binding protein n=1 Tax=Phenylobacterium sp. TaxID=1871053 RepID=UPI0027331651|nr:ABC transporter ATP-binding protein [Phenylobacterium sp.]MDP3175395.1 ABC transporter ATP-binding protein [Phenylobacterium sp.]
MSLAEEPGSPQTGRLHRALLDRAPWAYLWAYFRRRRLAVLVLGILGALQSVVFLPTLHMVRFAFDRAVPQGDIPMLVWIGLGLIGFRLLGSALALISRSMSLKVAKAAICEMRRDLIATLYALPRDFFGRNDAARVQTRIVMETERIDNLTSATLSTLLPAALTALCLLGALTWLNWTLVAMLAGLVPLMWLSTVYGGRYVKREVRAFQHAFEGFSHGVQFVVRQMDLTRVRGFEERELSRQSEGLRRLETSGVRMAMSFAFHQQVQSSLTGIGGLLLLVGGGIAVVHKAMTLGDLLAFYLAAGLLNGALSRVTAAIPDFIAGDESLRKLLELRGQVEAAHYQGQRPVSLNGGIDLRDVDFGYGGKPVLKGVSLSLAPGARTAIIGPNGAGKSTIVNLILGFLRPDAGGVFVEGAPYDDIDLRDLRRQIGVVMQKPTFFTGTVIENLTYGWPDVSRANVEAAAVQAHASDFIAGLPQGFDTMIGEGGTLISGGEAQRLAIARALIGQPRLLILDEPTNHLDAEAVSQIMQRIAADPARPAVLTISHDMAVVAFSDVVLRLEAGALRPMAPAALASLDRVVP